MSERGASLVAHYTGGVGVVGSNPIAPTILSFRNLAKTSSSSDSRYKQYCNVTKVP